VSGVGDADAVAADVPATAARAHKVPAILEPTLVFITAPD
jgi:hypothetical protein